MHARVKIVVTVAVALAGATLAHAAATGVQWTPDAARILVNKDVGDERWAITLNLADVSTTGNVFFREEDRAPSFVWCERTNHDFDSSIGELTIQYRCQGSNSAFGGFAIEDWSLISDDVRLPASFFIPPAETCDLRAAVNGANASSADSFWECSGNGGSFQVQFFDNGTGVSSATGSFEFDVVAQACSFGRLGDGTFLDVEYSPSRDRLTVYEVTASVDQVIVSECSRSTL